MINRKKNLSDYDELMASHCQVIHLQKEKIMVQGVFFHWASPKNHKF